MRRCCAQALLRPVALRVCCASTAMLTGRCPLARNYFESHVNETVILETADALISTGLAAAGFNSVNIDAGWGAGAVSRDAIGELVPDPVKWPRGMKAVCDALHAKGLHCGLYGDLSNRTCGGPSFMGHEEQDMQTFASWGVDCALSLLCADPALYLLAVPDFSATLRRRYQGGLLWLQDRSHRRSSRQHRSQAAVRGVAKTWRCLERHRKADLFLHVSARAGHRADGLGSAAAAREGGSDVRPPAAVEQGTAPRARRKQREFAHGGIR